MTSKSNEMTNRHEPRGASSDQFRGGAFARRRKFVLEYCRNGFRGSAAAISAGYSPRSARYIASELLSRPDISQQIKEITDRQLGRAHMSAKEALARLGNLARSDIRKFVDDHGNPIPIQELNEDIARCVKKLKVTTITTTKGDVVTEKATTELDVEPRTPALAILARHYRLVEDSVAPTTVPAALASTEMIELARRTAFMLTRAYAVVVEPLKAPPSEHCNSINAD